jgi:BMFP domain-containing protein YqiC
MATTNQRLAALESRCTAIETKNKAQDASISSLGAKNTSQDAQLSSLAGDDLKVAAVLERLEVRIAALEERPFPARSPA